MIVLTLPYPISANRYWRHGVVAGRAQTFVSKDAKDYRERVGWIAKANGVRSPLAGRLAVDLLLYPHRPLDYRTRMRKHGALWDDTVECIDLTNAEKVLMDALNGIAFEDDKQVRRYTAQRMEPDEKGARCILRIQPIVVAQPQQELVA